MSGAVRHTITLTTGAAPQQPPSQQCQTPACDRGWGGGGCMAGGCLQPNGADTHAQVACRNGTWVTTAHAACMNLLP
eukprot:362401-Chlamydomonas_euryale.AAC.5